MGPQMVPQNRRQEMRLTEIRRAIVRPLTEAAAEAIREGDLPTEGIETYRIPETTYAKYFQLFNDLHRICGVAADDFEVEEVEPERLTLLLQTLKTYPRRDTAGKLDTTLDDLLDHLFGICWRAQSTGVFFIT